MAAALEYTYIGHIVIGIVLGLEVLSYIWLKALLKVDA